MKNFILLAILFSIFFVNCNSQQKEDKTDQSIEASLLHHLELRNEAFKNNDLKTIYNYSHPFDLKGQTFDDFKKESEAYIQATKEDKLSFEILDVGKINYCNSEYQCMINLRTIVTTNNIDHSFDRKIIAISESNDNWKFINGGENDLETIKKLYSFVCLNEI